MSEVSILSAEFGALSKTVDEVNNSIIVLKTQSVNSAEKDKGEFLLEMEEGELEHAIDFTKAFLERLLLLEHPNEHSLQLLPNEAVTQLNNTVIKGIPDFFEQIRSMQVALHKQQVLNTSQLEVLDQIVEALDQERSELYKKLRAARG